MNNNPFAKMICTICFEDLKPNVEDLQSISICGHVFHELCIQQWFEYCTNGKKKNCPVCKQTCSEKNVSRLYFQSVGDPHDQSLSQKLQNCEENPEELRQEATRLEGKVSALSSALELQKKDLKEVNVELSTCKEQLKKEAAMKDDALKQKTITQQLLHLKSKELEKSTLECMRLQERSIALAKELAALKLVCDLDLDEDEVLKLASLGKETNSKETIDVLKRSLVIRNKSYKELMAKCNALGRGDARSLKKLEKAKEKIQSLKSRVQELETAIEAKDNEALRALKGLKESNIAVDAPAGADRDSRISFINRCSLKDQFKECAAPKISMNKMESVPYNLFSSGKTEDLRTSNEKVINSSGYVVIDDDEPIISTSVRDFNFVSAPKVAESKATDKDSGAEAKAADKDSRQGNAFDEKYNVKPHILGKEDCDTGSRTAIHCKSKTTETLIPNRDDDLVLILDDITLDQPSLNIRKDASSKLLESHLEPSKRPIESCFSGGLIGPDGNKWHLGKWCRRGQNKGSMVASTGVQGSNPSTGNLISVGADGRGGKIKVLRSLNQSLAEDRETSSMAKKCKIGVKTSTLQSRGCLQIDHYFGRTSQ
ncbi:Potyviral helper component protease-interacting protein 1 [Heracleum sosnowskyi]|uniref:Potyviral helper component protease-interacting protein 1 n=1 Tax=Heracleum sosnowskyi TaxID=360622 RepID=A0AAD8I1F1_9APIA|nr:Potyviral helper component protease-interacting protein 1 [Heracleum sosnowskyi]